MLVNFCKNFKQNKSQNQKLKVLETHCQPLKKNQNWQKFYPTYFWHVWCQKVAKPFHIQHLGCQKVAKSFHIQHLCSKNKNKSLTNLSKENFYFSCQKCCIMNCLHINENPWNPVSLVKILYNYGLNEKDAKRTMKVQKPSWEQRNLIGTRIKIMWEEQLVDPPIDYIIRGIVMRRYLMTNELI